MSYNIQLFYYGILALPIAFAGFPLYVVAPDYYNTKYNVSLTILGFILLALRMLDAIQDPIIGYLSDLYRKYSKIFIPSSAFALCIGIYGLFNHIYFSPLIWFTLCISLTITAYSILSINLSSLGAIWGSNYRQQTKIAAYRESFALIGLIIAVSLPQILKIFIPQNMVYVYYSLILMILTIIGLYCFNNWYGKQKNNFKNISKPIRFNDIFKLSDYSRKILIIYFISILASSIPAVLVIFFVRDLLNAANYTGLFLLLYFLSGALFTGMWQKISTYIGINKTWLISILVAVGSFAWAYFLKADDILPYALICISSGIALGADLVLPPALIANQIHKNNLKNNASIQYALLTFITKIALAFASVISLPLLEYSGFKPNFDNNEAALNILSTAYAIIPSLLKILAGILIWKYFIKKKVNNHENDNCHHYNDSRSDNV